MLGVGLGTRLLLIHAAGGGSGNKATTDPCSWGRAWELLIQVDSTNIDSYYLDGVSVTHGVPGSRQHIWSRFIAALSSNEIHTTATCPCHNSFGTPPYVGQDYFCETGNDNNAGWVGMFFANDPLWDGQDCGTSNTCECTLNNPPWFCKQLPQATMDDLEVRICGNQVLSDEDTPVELIELYVR